MIFKKTLGVLLLVSAASFTAQAQTAASSAPASAKATKAKSPCQGLEETACQEPTCKWIAPTTGKKPRKGYCRKSTAAKATPAPAASSKKATKAPAAAPQ